MFNPFSPFTSELLLRVIGWHGKGYFVNQRLGASSEVRSDGSISMEQTLLTFYTTHSDAQAHFKAIPPDCGRFIYDWVKKEDRHWLTHLALYKEAHAVYFSQFRQDWQSLITEGMQEMINQYAFSLWKIRDIEMVNCKFTAHFGELYITFQYRKKEKTVRLNDIINTRDFTNRL